VPRASASNAGAELRSAVQDLLNLYDAMGVAALVITVEHGTVLVHCLDEDVVHPITAAVVRKYEAPEGARLN